jgi:integrase
MASIHKDPRGKSPFWYCAYYLPDGGRAFKSTKQRDRARAMAFCLALERASKKAHNGSLTEIQVKESVSDLVEYTTEEQTTQRSVKEGKLLESQANKLLGQILVLGTGEGLTIRTLTEFCSAWIESKSTTKASGTTLRYRGVVQNFLKFVGNRKAKANIAAITPRDVQKFRDEEVRQGKTQSTANIGLKVLRSVFNTARRQGLITSNPAEAVETFAADKEARDVFTNEQIRTLLQTATGEWKTMILLGYYTGARLSDCAKMAWNNVDLPGMVLRYSPQKTSRGNMRKQQLEVPIMSELEAQLMSLPTTDDPDSKLSPILAKKATGGNHGLSSDFHRIIEKAGIPIEVGEKKSGMGRQFKRLGFHSLRHGFVSELANADVAAEIRQKISGHNSEEIHARYTHLEIETKRRAMEKMRSIGEPAS